MLSCSGAQGSHSCGIFQSDHPPNECTPISSLPLCLLWAGLHPGLPVPVLDGLGLAAAVSHNLGDILRLTPSALVREEGQFVNGRRRSQDHSWEKGTYQEP